MNAEREFLATLRYPGREAASRWPGHGLGKVGVRSSVNAPEISGGYVPASAGIRAGS